MGPKSYRTPANGDTECLVAADPAGTDFNPVLIKYTGAGFTSILGGQRINLASQRSIGGVGGRQNEKTFNAFRAKFPSTGKRSIDYTNIDNVNRIFRPDDSAVQLGRWESDSHTFLASYAIAGNSKISDYAYLLGFDDSAANSAATYGIDYAGKVGPVSLKASYAIQSDDGNNPMSYDAAYYNLEAGITISALMLSAGYELLGSDDGAAAFKTPLATGHKCQGWADKFLSTPAGRVKGVSIKVAGKLGLVKLALIYRDFEAGVGNAKYGCEVDFFTSYPANKKRSTQFKYARYEAANFCVDTNRAWFTINLKLKIDRIKKWQLPIGTDRICALLAVI